VEQRSKSAEKGGVREWVNGLGYDFSYSPLRDDPAQFVESPAHGLNMRMQLLTERFLALPRERSAETTTLLQNNANKKFESLVSSQGGGASTRNDRNGCLATTKW